MSAEKDPDAIDLDAVDWAEMAWDQIEGSPPGYGERIQAAQVYALLDIGQQLRRLADKAEG